MSLKTGSLYVQRSRDQRSYNRSSAKGSRVKTEGKQQSSAGGVYGILMSTM